MSALKLNLLYAKVPSFDCKAGCSDCCGPIMMSRAELKRITEHLGHEPNFTPTEKQLLDRLAGGATLDCPCLDAKTNRCTIYSIRPMICRVFGTFPELACPKGCAPTTPLTQAQADALINGAEAIES